MTERLTRDELDRCTHRYCNKCDGYRKEVQRYKGLEEQGRLVVLPEGFDLEKFKLAVASLFCPSVLGVDDIGCPAGDSVKRSDCLKCWEKVLKGE